MEVNNIILQGNEKIIFALRSIYSAHGFIPYRMSKFEEYDLYARNKDFLVSDNVITFTDTTGKLMALKPDVTLSIIKNSKDRSDRIQKVYYNENVYRVSKGTNSFSEMMQSGVECFGNIGNEQVTETILVAAEALEMLSDKYFLELSNLDLIESIIDDLDIESENINSLYKAIEEKNIPEINKLCVNTRAQDKLSFLKKLLLINTSVSDAYNELSRIIGDDNSFDDFRDIIRKLASSKYADNIFINFSVIDDINYYNGIVFKGFINEVPSAVLSGGQYDKLMKKMDRTSRAIGFAIYTDLLDRIDFDKDDSNTEISEYLNIALPKGRLGEKVYSLFSQAGYNCPEDLDENRKLIFENKEKKVRFFWVKPSDVGIYVERGAADVGIIGKDTLLEYTPDIYELLDLTIGQCKVVVAGPKGFKYSSERRLRVATKYPNIARAYYQSKGYDIDIIQLNGSIEIAPLLGLSDVIVDIVETGTTLRENNLEIVETIVPISARLISNKASFKFKESNINKIMQTLSSISKE